MVARRISPLAMILCLAAVMAIGWVMIEMTKRHPTISSGSDLKTYDMAYEPTPTRLTSPPAMPQMPAEMQRPTPPFRSVAVPGPDVSPAAAPGVAFSYRYAFRLPGERIARVQEQHARACEQLGASRCRITGLRYRRAGPGQIEAVLALSVEPGIARRFGRAGTEAVARAHGELIDAEITGDDADATIRAAGRGIAEMREDLQRVEARLAGRHAETERSRLDDEARRLRQSVRAAEASRDEREDALASTPMLFQYASGAPVAAGGRPEVGKAIERAGTNFIDGVAILFVIAVTLLPWLLLAGLGWWLFRLVWRRLGRSFPEAAPA